MDIRTYLFENKMSVKDLAALVGVHAQYISKIKNGHYIPSKKVTDKLREVTGGKVHMLCAKEIRMLERTTTNFKNIGSNAPPPLVNENNFILVSS